MIIKSGTNGGLYSICSASFYIKVSFSTQELPYSRHESPCLNIRSSFLYTKSARIPIILCRPPIYTKFLYKIFLQRIRSIQHNLVYKQETQISSSSVPFRNYVF
jgi:hypothetical protein